MAGIILQPWSEDEIDNVCKLSFVFYNVVV